MATTTRHYRNKTYRTHLLRRTFREDGKVKHETLGNISHLPDPVIDLIRRALKGETFVNPEQAFECVRSLPHGHVAAVLGTLKQLGLHTLIARGAGRLRDLVVALIVARVIDARSKLATARALAPESAVSTLGEALGLGDVDPHELYEGLRLPGKVEQVRAVVCSSGTNVPISGAWPARAAGAAVRKFPGESRIRGTSASRNSSGRTPS